MLEEIKKDTDIGVHHYWTEPLYGYYNSEDPWVFRKHLVDDITHFGFTVCFAHAEAACQLTGDLFDPCAASFFVVHKGPFLKI